MCTSTQEGETGFTNIDEAMKIARAKYANHPELLPDTTLPKYKRTLEDEDFDERVAVALLKTKGLIREGKSQLAAPIQAPAQLTPSEIEEAAAAEDWDFVRRRSFRLTDRMLMHNEQLLDDVMRGIDEYESPTPPTLLDLLVHSSSPLPRSGWSIHVPEDVRAWIQHSRRQKPSVATSGSVIIDEVRRRAAENKQTPSSTFIQRFWKIS